MASSFPGTLDSFATNRVDATVMATNQAADHNNYADAIAKIETKVGTGASTPVANSLLAGTGTGASGWSQAPVIGSGDAITYYNAATAQRLGIVKGTAASPDTTSDPLVKVERTMQLTSAEYTGDGVDVCSGIASVVKGTATNDGQTVGVAGLATSASTTAVSLGGDDACGIYGAGTITDSGTGVGIGGFFAGRRITDTGKAVGAEIDVANYTATVGSYVSSGFSHTTGLWMNAVGDADSAVAIAVSNAFGRQFKVGLAFPAQVTSSLTGGVADTTIRDDGNATTSIAINGTHTTALAVASTAGKVLIGRTTDAGIASNVIMQSTAAANTTLTVMAHASQSTRVFAVTNSSAGSLFTVGQTGTVTLAEAADIAVGTTTGTKIGTATGQKLGFWNSTPVVKGTVSGSRSANAALASLLTLLASYGLVVDSSSA